MVEALVNHFARSSYLAIILRRDSIIEGSRYESGVCVHKRMLITLNILGTCSAHIKLLLSYVIVADGTSLLRTCDQVVKDENAEH